MSTVTLFLRRIACIACLSLVGQICLLFTIHPQRAFTVQHCKRDPSVLLSVRLL